MTNPFLTHRLLLLALPLAGLLARPVRAQVAVSFAPPVTYSAPGFSGVTVADINGDGQPDVFTTNFNNNTVGVFLGISPANGGGFLPLQVYSTGAGSQPRDVAVADVNNDGLLDLVTANNGTSSVGVLLGKSAATGGGFQPVQQYITEPQTLYRTGPYHVKVADVNSDGQPDLAVANFTTNSVGVLLGRSAASGGGFQAAQVYSVGSASLPSDVEVADFNKDGVLDLVTANSNGDGVGGLLGKSAASGGGFQPVQFYSTTRSFTMAYPFKVAVADVNLDGVLDIVSANSNTYSVGVLLGKSAANGGGFQPVQEYITVNRKPYDIAVADVNGDTLPDVLVTQGSTVVVLLGKSAASGGGFLPVQEVQGAGGNIVVADVNTDGRPDLITDGITVLLNTVGSPTLTTSPATNLTTTSATLGGTLTGTSSGALTEYGVVYVLGSGAPTTSDTKVLVGTSSPATLPSTFSANITGLTDSRTYTVRAYATNSLGTGYGNPVTFSTPRPTTAAPVLTTPATGSVVSNRRPTLAGTAPAGSTVTLYLASGSSAAQAQAIGTTTATGGSFSFTLSTATILANGTYSVYATAQSLLENTSTSSNISTFTVNAPALTATLTTTAGSTTSTAPIPFAVTFSEAVTGFITNDIVVSNGTVSGGLTTVGNIYSFSVMPTATGPVTVSVPAGAAQDGAGSGNTAASPLSVLYASVTTAPTVMSLSPATGPVGTSVTLTGTNLSGATAIRFNGTAASSFVVNSATSLTAVVAAGTTTGPVSVTTPSGSATSATSFVVRVAPTTVADAYTTPQGITLAGNVLWNDLGTDAVAILVIRPSHGTLALNPDGSFSYQPAAGYVGPDGFIYYACDPGTPLLCGNPATVSITVSGGRVGPTTVADAYTTAPDVTLAGNVLSNDLGTNLRAILIIRPSHGTLALNPDGSFTYQAAAGYTGSDSFLYYACDLGTPLVCGDPATVTITVTPSTNTRVATSPTAVPTSASSSPPAATAAKPVAATGAIVRLELALTGHPNPFRDELQLHFTLPIAQTYTLAVYDAQGRLVQQLARSQAEASQAQELTVPTHTYATGLYLVRLTTATGTQLLKLIKQ